MLTKKIILIAIGTLAGLFVPAVGSFAFSPKTAAAAPAAHVLTYDGKNFPVDTGLLTSWRRTVKVVENNRLTRQTTDPKLLINRFVSGNRFNQPRKTTVYRYDPRQIITFVKTIAAEINTKPTEPFLIIENSRAVSFTPPQNGITVNNYQTMRDILLSLDNNSTSTPVRTHIVPPSRSLAELNAKGISELVARGESTFKGSPNNRRHNIAVGIEKMKGVIIAPGEEFSFNTFLGPVEKSAGFVPELVIKRTGTVPELGGGLCQVSSTTFRAAMAAGLPITQRKNHSYAVQYYAPQGTDATIYPGVIDLKFLNDTPGHLLIWPYLKDKDTLFFDFYGTKDDRQVVLEKPVQYDKKTDGSMKAYWNREVIKNGTSTKDSFKSVYQPPALFHRDEEFVATNTTPPNTGTGAETPQVATSTPISQL